MAGGGRDMLVITGCAATLFLEGKLARPSCKLQEGFVLDLQKSAG